MTDTDLEILAEDALDAAFDIVYDIRLNPVDTSFDGARIIEYDALLALDADALADASVLVVCDIGVRSKKAAAELRARGLTRVSSLAGGADALRRLRASADDHGLTQEETIRYDRQLRLAGFGIESQQRIKRASVVVIGAGGLGCPALSYLATAGVGSITIIDHDIVDATNLQRQPLYETLDVGRPKVLAARDRLLALNPLVSVTSMQEFITADNAGGMVIGADVVIDATDTFDVRYAVNQATVDAGIPLIYGSVYAFEGQFAAFDARSGPCYRCLFPQRPGEGVAFDCASVGVLGAVTGVIGSLQASAALQIIAGSGNDLHGWLTLFDARTGRFDRLSVAKRQACDACGRR
jgi:adenylyltransferase/sulfurtransferase